MDYKTLTDEQLDKARQAILADQERHANPLQIHTMIQELATKCKERGGNQQELLKAVGDSE